MVISFSSVLLSSCGASGKSVLGPGCYNPRFLNFVQVATLRCVRPTAGSSEVHTIKKNET